jgi:AraC family transcriptional regulator
MRPTIPADEMTLHAHADAHFVLVLGGSYRSLAYPEGMITHGPALVFNPPGTEHRDCFLDLRASFMTVSLDAGRFARLADFRQMSGPVHLDAPGALDCALSLFRAAYGGDNPLHTEALALELVAATANGTRLRGARHAPGWLGAVTDLIQDHSHDRLGLDAIAKAVDVHPVYLTRAFKRWTGLTPGEYHRRCRMERAFAELMRSTRPTVDIALAAGYADQAHFTRAFAAVYGIAPARFARMLGERKQVRSVQDAAHAAAP